MIKLKKFAIVISSEESLCVKGNADEEENVVVEEIAEKEVVKNDVIEEKVVIKDVAESKTEKKDVSEKNAAVSEAVMKVREF